MYKISQQEYQTNRNIGAAGAYGFIFIWILAKTAFKLAFWLLFFVLRKIDERRGR